MLSYILDIIIKKIMESDKAVVIQRNEKFNTRIPVHVVHRQFPYKYYLKIIGNNSLGDVIAVVSNTELDTKLLNRVNMTTDDALISKRFALEDEHIGYRTELLSIMEVKNMSVYVFEQSKYER